MIVLAGLISILQAPLACSTEVQSDQDVEIAESAPDFSERGISVYALSRGRGVPGPAREAIREVLNIFNSAKENGSVQWINQYTLGLEGETRVCANFTSAAEAHKTWQEVQEIVDGIDLVNLTVEPCPEQNEK